jgi:hypothetical protein
VSLLIVTENLVYLVSRIRSTLGVIGIQSENHPYRWYCARWCNGGVQDFGSAILGSSPTGERRESAVPVPVKCGTAASGRHGAPD